MIGMMYIVAVPILTVVFYGPMAMLVAFVYSIWQVISVDWKS